MKAKPTARESETVNLSYGELSKRTEAQNNGPAPVRKREQAAKQLKSRTDCAKQQPKNPTEEKTRQS